jgi:hypothetical protein
MWVTHDSTTQVYCTVSGQVGDDQQIAFTTNKYHAADGDQLVAEYLSALYLKRNWTAIVLTSLKFIVGMQLSSSACSHVSGIIATTKKPDIPEGYLKRYGRWMPSQKIAYALHHAN